MLSHMDGCIRETPEAQIQHHLALGLALTWLLICGPQAIPRHQLHSYLTDRTSCYMNLTDWTSFLWVTLADLLDGFELVSK